MDRRFAEVVGFAKRYHAKNPHILQTLAAFSIKIVGALLSFGFTILIARHFGPVGVGQFGLAVTTLLIVSTVALCGLDYILIRTVAGDLKLGAQGLARGAIRTVTGFTLVNAVVLSVLLTVETRIGPWFSLGADGLVLRAVTFGLIPVTMIRIVSSSLRSCGHVLLAQFLDGPLSMALSIAAVFGLLLAGHSGTMAQVGVIYVVAIGICVAIGTVVHIGSVRDWQPATRVALPPLLAQSWPIMCIVLTGFFVDWLILVTLSHNRSAAEVGLFRSAWQVASIFNLIIVSFDAVAGPRIAAAYRVGDIDGIGQTWRQSVLIILGLSAPLFILTLGFPEFVLGIFGAEFKASATTLRILSLAQLVNVLTGPTGSVMIMSGRERTSLVIAVSATTLALVLSLALVPAYGLTGAAVASALTVVFRTATSWFIAGRAFKLTLWPR